VAVKQDNPAYDELDPATYPFVYRTVPSSSFRVPRMTVFANPPSVLFSGLSAGGYGAMTLYASLALPQAMPAFALVILDGMGRITSSTVDGQCSFEYAGEPRAAAASSVDHRGLRLDLTAPFAAGANIDLVIACTGIKLPMDLHGTSTTNHISFLPDGEDQLSLSQLNSLVVTAPDQTVHFAYEKPIYTLDQAAQTVAMQLAPLGVTVDAAGDFELRVLLPTEFPHLFSTAAGMTASVSAAASCADPMTEVVPATALALDGTTHVASLPLPAHPLLTDTACLTVTVAGVDAVPLGVPAQAITVQLRHLPSASHVAAELFPVPLMPSDPSMAVPSDPANTQTCSNYGTLTSCQNTFTVSLPAPLNVSPDVYVVLQTFTTEDTHCSIDAGPTTVLADAAPASHRADLLRFLPPETELGISGARRHASLRQMVFQPTASQSAASSLIISCNAAAAPPQIITAADALESRPTSTIRLVSATSRAVLFTADFAPYDLAKTYSSISSTANNQFSTIMLGFNRPLHHGLAHRVLIDKDALAPLPAWHWDNVTQPGFRFAASATPRSFTDAHLTPLVYAWREDPTDASRHEFIIPAFRRYAAPENTIMALNVNVAPAYGSSAMARLYLPLGPPPRRLPPQLPSGPPRRLHRPAPRRAHRALLRGRLRGRTQARPILRQPLRRLRPPPPVRIHQGAPLPPHRRPVRHPVRQHGLLPHLPLRRRHPQPLLPLRDAPRRRILRRPPHRPPPSRPRQPAHRRRHGAAPQLPALGPRRAQRVPRGRHRLRPRRRVGPRLLRRH
jgi:hypothetical protein